MKVNFYNADGGLMESIVTNSPSRVIRAHKDNYDHYEIVGAAPVQLAPACAYPDIPDPLATDDILA